jgi:hypothetical protein
VSVLAPAVVGVSVQVPAATVPVHVTVPSLTVTFPVGVPPVDVTVKVIAIPWPTTDGLGVWPVIVVVVAAAFTVTVAVCVIATALIVAETVFAPAAVALKLPVETPFTSVVPTGCVNVLPADGATASVTDAPWIGLLFASRAVTVIVALPFPTVIGEVAATVDCAAETGPAFTSTVAVCVIATVLIVAETVFEPATVEASVPVVTPLALVVLTGWVSALPVVGVTASTTVAPWIGLPFASFAVTVMVDVPLPAVIGDAAATVDTVADTAPAVTTTVAVCVIATVLIVAETVFDSATVELKLPVATPLALVVPTGWVSVFPVPVAASTTVAP